MPKNVMRVIQRCCLWKKYGKRHRILRKCSLFVVVLAVIFVLICNYLFLETKLEEEYFSLDGSLHHFRFKAPIDSKCLDAFSSSLTANSKLPFQSADFDYQRQLVDELENWLKPRYFQAARHSFSSSDADNVKYIQYSCEYRSLCGGFGDRTRGMVTLFYLALLSNRLFHVRWFHPVDLESYFELNKKLYELPPSFSFPFKSPRYAEISKFFDSKDDADLALYVSNSNFTNQHSDEKVISIRTNLLKIIGNNGPFENRHFLPSICYYFRGFPKLSNLTQTALYSAALRILFTKPTIRLQSDFESFLEKIVFPKISSKYLRNRLWSRALKIGIQIRLERSDWMETPSNRVVFEQIRCFINETERIVEKVDPESVIVFVTSSDNKASVEVVESLKIKHPHLNVVTITLAPVIHVDRYHWQNDYNSSGTSPFRMTKRDLLRGHAKVVLDWFLLTRMDRLIVSQSSFASSASLYSMAPTRYFDHAGSFKSVESGNGQCIFFDPIF